MNNENGDTSLVWEAVIRNFLNKKRNNKEEKYLKDVLKRVKDGFAKAKWFNFAKAASFSLVKEA